MSRWLELFPLDAFLVLFREAINLESGCEPSELYRFLLADEVFNPPLAKQHFNASKQSRSSLLVAGMRHGAKAMRRIADNEFVRNIKNLPAINQLSDSIKQDLYDVIAPVREETKHRLTSVFADDMCQLVDILGMQNLPWNSWRLVQNG